MIGDCHRTLCQGGIFMYPGNEKKLNGKLRLLYELNPMAFIFEAAGGVASTGKERILDIIPDDIAECRPCFMGRKDIMEEFLKQM